MKNAPKQIENPSIKPPIISIGLCALRYNLEDAMIPEIMISGSIIWIRFTPGFFIANTKMIAKNPEIPVICALIFQKNEILVNNITHIEIETKLSVKTGSISNFK